jgi:hypothetical protein
MNEDYIMVCFTHSVGAARGGRSLWTLAAAACWCTLDEGGPE